MIHARHLQVFASFCVAVVFAFLLAVPSTFGQSKWVRIEHKKEIFFALPEGFLVNDEHNSYSSIKSLLGFDDGVSMRISLSEQANSESNLKRVWLDESRKPFVVDFEIDGSRGRSVIYSDRGYEHSLYLASSKGYYVLSVSSRSKDHPVIVSFLNSIYFRSKPIFQSGKATAVSEGDTASTKNLKTSLSVEEARERKFDMAEKTIRFEPLASFVPCDGDFSIRPAFFATRPKPELGGSVSSTAKSGEVRLNVQLLANGQVGEIVAFSDLDRTVVKSFAKAAKDTRFVPAEKDGKAIDSCQTIRSTMIITGR